MNVDKHKSFGKHDPEQPIDELNAVQAKFAGLNSFLLSEPEYKKTVNYAIGQNGLEFESQVNDICDAFEDYFKTYLKGKTDKDEWISTLVSYASQHILDEDIFTIMRKFDLMNAFDFNYDAFYMNAVVIYFILHGMLHGNDKLWYLDEALKTHFKEDVKV